MDSVRRATNRAFGADDKPAETENEGFDESSELDDDVNHKKALRGLLIETEFVGILLNCVEIE
ncbi:hypothetical protein Hanom_Chr14g01320011 [Helianthus anomalus]